ncbi:MAG: DNA polymerase III subunit delta [Marinilabiliales bacterium]|nr:DNA polymerase III subunit delta [Marinilabiliales bacterium]
MDFQKILADLKEKKYATVYFLEGEEPYYIDLISDYILDHVLSESEKAFNQTLLYGKDINLDALLTAARRYPMMAEKQVVVVREAQNIREIEDLVSYVEKPAPTTILVLCYKYKYLDKRKKLYKAVQKQGVYLESKPLYENQIPNWIVAYLKTLGLGIEPKAAQMIADHVGNNLQRIVNELEKVVFSAVPGTSITVDAVEKNIGISKEYNPFEFQKAIGAKDLLKANRIANYFVENDKAGPMPMVVSVLAGYFRKILTYHALSNKGNNQDIAQQLGISPFFVQDYVTAGRNYPLQKAVLAISLLREYDLRSKGGRGGSVDTGDLLREMTYKILHL